LGEIRRGIAALPQSRRRATLEAWLDKDLRERFEDRILAIDQEVADRWGLLTAAARNSGIVLPVIDGLLAATALEHNLTLGYKRYWTDSIDRCSSLQSVGFVIKVGHGH
jgi:predicted nucleic acid-binding protein